MNVLKCIPLEKILYEEEKKISEFLIIDSIDPQIKILEQGIIVQKESIAKKLFFVEQLKKDLIHFEEYIKKQLETPVKIIEKCKEFIEKNSKTKINFEKISQKIVLQQQKKSFNKINDSAIHFIVSHIKHTGESINERKRQLQSKIETQEKEISRIKRSTEQEQKELLEANILCLQQYIAKEQKEIEKNKEEIDTLKQLKQYLKENF